MAPVPSPTRLVYFVLLGAFLIQALGVAIVAETSARKPGALRSRVLGHDKDKHLRSTW